MVVPPPAPLPAAHCPPRRLLLAMLFIVLGAFCSSLYLPLSSAPPAPLPAPPCPPQSRTHPPAPGPGARQIDGARLGGLVRRAG